MVRKMVPVRSVYGRVVDKDDHVGDYVLSVV